MREMLLGFLVAFLTTVPAAADDVSPPADADAALARLAADIETYRSDPDAMAAAPDSIRQAAEAVADLRARLPEAGASALALEIRHAERLVALIAELIEARALERQADAEADRVVEALERLAVVRSAYQRITEQLHLHALPMPGEGGR
jgi:hypothetical protein